MSAKRTIAALSSGAASPTPAKKKPVFHGGWQNLLKTYIDAPESFGAGVVKQFDDNLVVICDAFPKAKKHWLVLPRTTSADSVAQLTKVHLPILHLLAATFDTIKLEHPDINLRAGFHALPSMAHLHLHVISDDFVSPALKHKKHWNSFTTRFFIPLDEVLRQVQESGKVEINDKEFEELLKGPLVCHKCGKTQKNIPTLKQHLEHHLKE
ncbi:HIT-like domain-containing protein [Chytriomyces sp. MP71]|nr:HIT-like domain-containing protein [Chytriomyces sp. MP71]